MELTLTINMLYEKPKCFYRERRTDDDADRNLRRSNDVLESGSVNVGECFEMESLKNLQPHVDQQRSDWANARLLEKNL